MRGRSEGVVLTECLSLELPVERAQHLHGEVQAGEADPLPGLFQKLDIVTATAATDVDGEEVPVRWQNIGDEVDDLRIRRAQVVVSESDRREVIDGVGSDSLSCLHTFVLQLYPASGREGTSLIETSTTRDRRTRNPKSGHGRACRGANRP